MRNELGAYFGDLSDKLADALKPVTNDFRKTLEEIVEMSKSFSQNIERGSQTLNTFHDAVETLGTSAQEAVRELSTIMAPSRAFLVDVQKAQQDIQKQFVDTVAKVEAPVSALATSSAKLQSNVATLGTSTQNLATAVQGVDSRLTSQRQELTALHENLKNLTKSIEKQDLSFSSLSTSFEQAAEIRPVLEKQLARLGSAIEALRETEKSESSQLDKEVTDILELLQQRLAYPDTLAKVIAERLEGTLASVNPGKPETETAARSLIAQEVHELREELIRLHRWLKTALDQSPSRPATNKTIERLGLPLPPAAQPPARQQSVHSPSAVVSAPNPPSPTGQVAARRWELKSRAWMQRFTVWLRSLRGPSSSSSANNTTADDES